MHFGIKDLIDVLLVAVFLYQTYKIMKSSGTLAIFSGVVSFVIVWILVSQILEMRLLGAILDKVISVGVIVLIILFQDEIRRFLLALGSHKGWKFLSKLFGKHRENGENDPSFVAPVVLACMNMAKKKTGALICIEQDVDLTVYEKYAGGDYDFGIETGNKEQFTDAIVELLMPIAPILKVVLTGEDLSLLVDKEGNNAITVYGAEGYKYAVIPVLEALDRDNPNIKTAEEYYADIENDPEALIRDILVPVFDFLDYVLEDPMNNLLASMPSLVYFINSKGLDTAFKNIVRPVTDVLTAMEPITGPVNLYDVIGIEVATVDFEYLFNMLVDMLGEGLGEELVPAVGNAISDMTMGKLVTFTSKNGKQAVTMEYVEGDANLAGSADMLTIILRFALKWITMPENQETVKSLITQYIPDAEAAEYVIGTYETLVSYLNKDHGINMMLGVLYYIFYGLDIAVDETNDWFDDVNGKWKFIMDLFDQAESDYLINFGDALDKLFGITDDVIDEDGIASSGLVPFFQKIINFFKTIIEWLRSLFGLN